MRDRALLAPQLFVQLVCDTVVSTQQQQPKRVIAVAWRAEIYVQDECLKVKLYHQKEDTGNCLKTRIIIKKKEMEKPMRLLAVKETHFPSYNIFITASSSSASEKSLKNAS